MAWDRASHRLRHGDAGNVSWRRRHCNRLPPPALPATLAAAFTARETNRMKVEIEYCGQ